MADLIHCRICGAHEDRSRSGPRPTTAVEGVCNGCIAIARKALLEMAERTRNAAESSDITELTSMHDQLEKYVKQTAKSIVLRCVAERLKTLIVTCEDAELADELREVVQGVEAWIDDD